MKADGFRRKKKSKCSFFSILIHFSFKSLTEHEVNNCYTEHFNYDDPNIQLINQHTT